MVELLHRVCMLPERWWRVGDVTMLGTFSCLSRQVRGDADVVKRTSSTLAITPVVLSGWCIDRVHVLPSGGATGRHSLMDCPGQTDITRQNV